VQGVRCPGWGVQGVRWGIERAGREETEERVGVEGRRRPQAGEGRRREASVAGQGRGRPAPWLGGAP